MPRLTFQDLIVGVNDDPELRRYRVLSALQKCRREFRANRLYPTLSELITLWQEIDHLLAAKATFDLTLPQRIVEVDLRNERLVVESTVPPDANLETTLNFIEELKLEIWRVVWEGVALYDYVEENIVLNEVGIMPVHNTEGYWFACDEQSQVIYIIRYEVTIYRSAKDKFRALKTMSLETVPLEEFDGRWISLKHNILQRYKDLPQPATFVSSLKDKALELPFNDTILPVTKRMLMARLQKLQKNNKGKCLF